MSGLGVGLGSPTIPNPNPNPNLTLTLALALTLTLTRYIEEKANFVRVPHAKKQLDVLTGLIGATFEG